MAEYECSYNVEYNNEECDDKCTINKCICDNKNKSIVIYIKTEFTQFHIEYYVLGKRTYKEFDQALEHWNNKFNQTHFAFPGVGGHVITFKDNKWYLNSSKCDGSHAPYYECKINISNPDKIISVIKKIYHSLG